MSEAEYALSSALDNLVRARGAPEYVTKAIVALIDERVEKAIGSPREKLPPFVAVPAMPQCSVEGCSNEATTHAVYSFNGGEPTSRYLCEKHFQEEVAPKPTESLGQIAYEAWETYAAQGLPSGISRGTWAGCLTQHAWQVAAEAVVKENDERKSRELDSMAAAMKSDFLRGVKREVSTIQSKLETATSLLAHAHQIIVEYAGSENAPVWYRDYAAFKDSLK